MYRFSLLIFSTIILWQTANATDYYISSSDIAANDSNNGISPATPWKTLSKVSSIFSTLKPGDRILFNRGDTFYGTLNISKSGSSGSPIIVSAYGTGAKPIFTGFTTLSAWTDEGGGIYSKAIPVESRPTILTFDGENTAKGRYPNSTWLSVDSYDNNTSITDADLSASPDYDEGQIVIQKNVYVLDVALITDHSDHKITYTSSETSNAAVGNRYFIQDHVATLDAYKEWAYSPSIGKIYVYFGTNNPNDHAVKIATIDRFADIKGRSYIKFDGLHFTGYNDVVFYIGTSTNNYITFNDCTFDFIGNCGIFGDANAYNNYTTITNNTFDNINGQGLYFWLYANYLNISNNTFTNIAYIRGLGGNLSYASAIRRPTGNGIFARGDYLTISNNVIENIGYCGIWFLGTNALVQNNLIRKTNQILTDGGSVYTWMGGNKKDGQQVKNNIITNSPNGYGIYLDDMSRSMVVSGNTVSGCALGIYLHNAHEIEIEGNVLYDCGILNFFVHDNYATNDPIRNVKINNNIFFAKISSQRCFSIRSIVNDNLLFGTADNNYYTRPIKDDDVFSTNQPSTGTKYRTLEGWQSFTGQDLNSHKSPIAITDVNTILFEYNASKTDKIVTLSKPMIDVTGKKYTGSVTLAPYTSIILMVDPNPAQTMTPVYQSSVIENATPSIITMTYSETLDNVIPPTNAFTVRVNGSTRSVTSVSISGTKVLITLSSPVIYGDIVTVAYSKPTSGPVLQATSGDPAESISAQNVTNNVNPPNPVYVSSVVENATPSKIDITYNLTLKSVSISASAFSVKVNTITRTVSSVLISGSKVYLTLASPIVNGDIVTVAYTKPSTNFIQTPDGGQAVSFTAKPVTNNVNPIQPVYVSSVIEDAAPDKLVMTYNLSLANTTPAPEAFSVLVDNNTRNVTGVAVSGTQVTLTLASAVVFGNIVTVAYTKPALSPLQTTSGAYAATISAQPVTNNVADNSQNLFPPVIAVSFESSAFSGFVYEIDASGSSDPNGDVLSFSWNPPSDVPVSSTTGSRIRFLAPVVTSQTEITIALSVNDGTTTQSKNLSINILPYKPELSMGKVDIVEASNSYSTDIPDKAIDSDLATKWSMDGDNHWLRFDLPGPFKMSHLMLAFLPEQKFESYFDIFVSQDNISWEPVLLNAKSCDFSGAFQVFDFPFTKTSTDYTSVKLVGHGNSSNTWNYFSEFKIFGTPGEDINDPLSPQQENIYIYPNPADDFINVQVLEPFDKVQHLRIFDFSGRLCHESRLDAGINSIQIPLDLKSGVYIAQVILGKLITFSQKLLVID